MRKPIPRRRYVIASLVLTFAATLAIASYAIGSEDAPRVRASLPVGLLPTISLSASERIAIGNRIGTDLAAMSGITEESFAQAREVAQTAAGRMLFLPGAKGACLVVEDGASCGDPGGEEQPLLALVTSVGSSSVLVGGGVTTADMHVLVISVPGGKSMRIPVTNGIFTITAADGVPRVVGLEFRAE